MGNTTVVIYCGNHFGLFLPILSVAVLEMGGRFAILLLTFLYDTFPIGLLYATMHTQFVVEVGILVPEVIDATGNDDVRRNR